MAISKTKTVIGDIYKNNIYLYIGIMSGVIVSIVIWQLIGRMVLQTMFFPLVESTFVIIPLLGVLWPITLFLSGILMLFSATRGFVSWWLKRALPLWFSLTIILFVLQICVVGTSYTPLLMILFSAAYTSGACMLGLFFPVLAVAKLLKFIS